MISSTLVLCLPLPDAHLKALKCQRASSSYTPGCYMNPFVDSFLSLDFLPLKFHTPNHFSLHYLISSMFKTQLRQHGTTPQTYPTPNRHPINSSSFLWPFSISHSSCACLFKVPTTWWWISIFVTFSLPF